MHKSAALGIDVASESAYSLDTLTGIADNGWDNCRCIADNRLPHRMPVSTPVCPAGWIIDHIATCATLRDLARTNSNHTPSRRRP